MCKTGQNVPRGTPLDGSSPLDPNLLINLSSRRERSDVGEHCVVPTPNIAHRAGQNLTFLAHSAFRNPASAIPSVPRGTHRDDSPLVHSPASKFVIPTGAKRSGGTLRSSCVELSHRKLTAPPPLLSDFCIFGKFNLFHVEHPATAHCRFQPAELWTQIAESAPANPTLATAPALLPSQLEIPQSTMPGDRRSEPGRLQRVAPPRTSRLRAA
jgi:hypothetical protein